MTVGFSLFLPRMTIITPFSLPFVRGVILDDYYHVSRMIKVFSLFSTFRKWAYSLMSILLCGVPRSAIISWWKARAGRREKNRDQSLGILSKKSLCPVRQGKKWDRKLILEDSGVRCLFCWFEPDPMKMILDPKSVSFWSKIRREGSILCLLGY